MQTGAGSRGHVSLAFDERVPVHISASVPMRERRIVRFVSVVAPHTPAQEACMLPESTLTPVHSGSYRSFMHDNGLSLPRRYWRR